MSSTVALPAHAFDFLRATVRQADVRYTYLAHSLSAHLARSLTHHARLTALKRGLAIDTLKAKRCPQVAVSVVPLPIIECASPPLVIVRPIPMYAPDYTGLSSIKVPDAPAMICRPLPDDVEMVFSALESDFSSDDEMAISPLSPDSKPPRIMWRITTQPLSFDSYVESDEDDFSWSRRTDSKPF